MTTTDQSRIRTMFLIVELGRRMTAPVEILWGDVGLTPTEGVVLARLIVEYDGRARSGDLVNYPVRSTAALAKVRVALESGDLIRRVRRDDDRRRVDIEATPIALDLFRNVFGRITDEVASPTAHPLNDHELRQLHELLERLTPPVS